MRGKGEGGICGFVDQLTSRHLFSMSTVFGPVSFCLPTYRNTPVEGVLLNILYLLYCFALNCSDLFCAVQSALFRPNLVLDSVWGSHAVYGPRPSISMHFHCVSTTALQHCTTVSVAQQFPMFPMFPRCFCVCQV